MRISEDKVSVKTFLKHFAHIRNEGFCFVSLVLWKAFCVSVHLRGSGSRCGLLCVRPGRRAAQKAERNTGHAQRPGELPISGQM